MRYRLVPLILVLSLLCSTAVLAANNGHSKRNIDDNDTIVVHGNVPPQAEAKYDRGPTDRNLKYEKMILLLQPRASARTSIERLVADLNNFSSPSYHQWLTPEQFGKQFGPAGDDVDAIVGWLQQHGFTIDEIAPGRLSINFTGSVGDVQSTVHTSIHDFHIEANAFHANL